MLHDLQHHDPHHYLSEGTLHAVSTYLDLPPADVKGTASFYTMFSFTPRGKHIIRACDSPPCQLEGGNAILEKMVQLLGVSPGMTTEDGLFTLEVSSCLGHCDEAPVLMIDETVYGDLTEKKVEAIIGRLRREDAAS